MTFKGHREMEMITSINAHVYTEILDNLIPLIENYFNTGYILQEGNKFIFKEQKG